jgi:hypothetical protein
VPNVLFCCFVSLFRYPDEPKDDEREAFSAYFYLFARLYPWWGFGSFFDFLFDFPKDRSPPSLFVLCPRGRVGPLCVLAF